VHPVARLDHVGAHGLHHDGIHARSL
jgi:hypothetical protein